MDNDFRDRPQELHARTEIAGLNTAVLTSLLETGRSKDETALQQITTLTRSSMHSVVCAISRVDVERRLFKAVASAGIPENKEKLIRAREFLLSTTLQGYNFELITQGREIERYGLDLDGQGLVKTATASMHGIRSLLAVPLEVQNRFWGYINHFSDQETEFRSEQKRLLRIFGRFAEVALEKLDQFDLQMLNRFTQWLLNPSGNPEQLCQQVCEIMKAPVGVLWELDDDNPRFLCVTAATTEVDSRVRQIRLDLNKHKGLKHHLDSRSTGYLTDVRKSDPRYEHASLAAEFGWVSLLTKPLYAGERVIGMLDIYSTRKRSFAEWEIHLFDIVGNQLAMYLQRTALRRVFLEDIGHETSEAGNRARIAREYAEIAGAEYGSLYFFNPGTQQLESQAFWRSDHFPPISLPPAIELGNGISGRAALERKTIYVEDTQIPANNVVEPGRSVLAVPMGIDQDLFGVFIFGSSLANAFQETLTPCESLLREVPPIIARIHGREMLRQLTRLTARAQTCEEYLNELSKLLLLLMRASGSVSWTFDKDQNEFRPQFVKYPGDSLSSEPQVSFSRDKVKEFPYCFEPHFPSPLRFSHRLAVAVTVDARIVCILEVGSDKSIDLPRRSLLDSLAEQASTGLKNIGRKQALEHLNKTFRKIAEATSPDQIIDIVLESALWLTQTRYGNISKLNPITEKLLMVKHSVPPETGTGELQIGQGLTGYALKHLKPVRVDDVSQRSDYYAFWKNMKSELAVPMFVDAAKIRVNTELQPAQRPIGIINVESPSTAAFTAFDEECLVALASHAAAVLDKLDFEEKLWHLHNADTALTALVAANEDWDKVADKVLDCIIQTFGYPHVNLSLVTIDGKRIKTVKVRSPWLGGTAEAEVFMRAADHPLNSNDIQADVVRSKQIMVPSHDDPRFDRKIHSRFRLDQLVRVYIPMMLNGTVIGTMEAGYPKRFQKHIYERDIQLLNVFVTYASEAIGRRRRGILDQFSHDFKDAVNGIWINTEYLQDNRAELSDENIDLKLNDIMADCEILRSQIDHLEYFLRGRSSTPWVRLTHLARDVIMKTIKQMQVLIRQEGLSAQIVFHYGRFSRIRIQTDKTLLCQVMTNLFINAIKYRSLEAKRLRMEIDIQNRGEFYFIRVRDWGMGVEEGLEEKIFDEGFRAPQAKRRVQGTGFGLTMSRQIMRSLGGDLKLSHSANPTEFEATVPKRQKGTP